MSLLTEDVRRFIGHKSERFAACEAIEGGAVRRFCQAIMDCDEAYREQGATPGDAHAITPPLYPVFSFRTPFGANDVLTERASDGHFDGLVAGVGNGLPELPLRGLALLNGGAEVEFYQDAMVGDLVFQQSTYHDIVEKQSKAGPMLLVRIDTLYTNQHGQALLRYRRTQIRR